jgi:hypothetical protein
MSEQQKDVAFGACVYLALAILAVLGHAWVSSAFR